jgi:shikimate kinase
VTTLVIVGLPGSGKTSVAEAVAHRLERPYLDTDQLLADATGVPTAQFLRDVGEAEFRVRECEVLEAAVLDDAVIATGGGIVASERARELLKRQRTIWLDCDDELLVERVHDGDRPLLTGDRRESIARLRAERSSWYHEVSLARVDSSERLEDVVERVIQEAERAG